MGSLLWIAAACQSSHRPRILSGRPASHAAWGRRHRALPAWSRAGGSAGSNP